MPVGGQRSHGEPEALRHPAQRGVTRLFDPDRLRAAKGVQQQRQALPGSRGHHQLFGRTYDTAHQPQVLGQPVAQPGVTG